MAKRASRPRDPNQLAKRIVDIAIGDAKDDFRPPSARRKGGLKGGKARASRLTPEQRRDIASTAARARWKKR